jgi:hypothetical protein
MKRVGDLEIAEDMKAQRRNWEFAVVGSAVMVMVALWRDSSGCSAERGS